MQSAALSPRRRLVLRLYNLHIVGVRRKLSKAWPILSGYACGWRARGVLNSVLPGVRRCVCRRPFGLAVHKHKSAPPPNNDSRTSQYVVGVTETLFSLHFFFLAGTLSDTALRNPTACLWVVFQRKKLHPQESVSELWSIFWCLNAKCLMEQLISRLGSSRRRSCWRQICVLTHLGSLKNNWDG